MIRRHHFLIGVIAMTFAAAPLAAQTGGLSTLELDRITLETLKDVHNKGADLYNTGDAAACYRMYQGALVTARPYLAHHPAIQKLIEDGLIEVAKSEGVKIQAFRLHEIIEQVRTELKSEIKKADASKPKDPPTAVIGPPSIVQPKPPTETPKPVVPPKTTTPPEKPKDPPMPPKPADPPAAKGGMISGKVTLDGKPAAGVEVTFVTLDEALPKVYNATVKDDGLYAVTTPMNAGKYAVMATGKGVSEKYQSLTSSGLTVTVKDGTNALDLSLTK